MTLDHDLWRNAAAACAVAAPHRAPGEDWPCKACRLATATAPSAGGLPASPGGGAIGAAGGVRTPARDAAAPPSAKPRFDDDPDEWDANGWERVPTWERRPR